MRAVPQVNKRTHAPWGSSKLGHAPSNILQMTAQQWKGWCLHILLGPKWHITRMEPFTIDC